MKSFLNRNITLNLFYGNDRNYSHKDFYPKTTRIRTLNSLEKEKSPKQIFQTIDNTIFSIFKIVYFKEFPNILTNNSKLFLRNVNTKAEEFIKKNLIQKNFSSPEIKSHIIIAKEKILNLYNEEFSFLKESYLNYLKNPKKYELLKDNTLIHCMENYNKNIYHKCGAGKYGNFISIKKNRDNFYICIKCKKCYKNNYINLFCIICKKEYYGSVYKKIGIDSNSNRDIYLATWKKYHCGLIHNEIMKCVNCKNYFYYNIKTNKLICENKKCKFTSNPENIEWKCAKCLKEFKSEVKPFNPYEYKSYKKELYYIILNKNKAKPLNINKCFNCKKLINIGNITFYHNKKCNGELYKGTLFNKDIIVCSKCLYSNYIEEFIWTCPLCNNEITENNNDIDKEKEDINIKINKIYFTKRIFNRRVKNLRNNLKNEKENEIDSYKANTLNSINNEKSILNNYGFKRLSNQIKVQSIRNYLKSKNIKTLEKDNTNEIGKDKESIHYLETDINIRKESSNSSPKYNLNNSTKTFLSKTRNSLENKDQKTFNSIINTMKNRMLNSKNKNKNFNQTEDKEIKTIDNKNKKQFSTNTFQIPNKFISSSIDIDKKYKKKERPKIEINNRILPIHKFNNEEKGNKNESMNNIISVRKSLTLKTTENKLNNGSKSIENTNNSLITPQRKLKGLRSKYKEKKKTIINNITNERNIYTKEKIGYFYKKNNKTDNLGNNNDSLQNKKDESNNNDYKFKSKLFIKDKEKNGIYSIYKDDNKLSNNKKFIFKKINKEKNNKEKNEDNQNNIIKKHDKDNNNIIKQNYNDNNNKIVDETNNSNNNKEKKNDKNNNPGNNNFNIVNLSNYYLRRKTFQNNNNLPSPKNEKENNKIQSEIKNEQNNEKVSKFTHFRTINKFKYIKNNKIEENEDKIENKTDFKTYTQKGFNKNTKKNVITKKKDSVSSLIKKNLEKFFDNKNEDNNNLLIKKGKSHVINLNNNYKLQNVLDKDIHKISNFEENSSESNISSSVSRKSNEFLKNRNNKEELNLENDNFNDNDNEAEKENDIINDLNIRKVIQHFARRNSVVNILREIEKEDDINNDNKNKEKNHFVLEGLINHVNLMSSPEKITLLEKNSLIPIFSDNDYTYCQNIGEGSNANVYLVKDNKTNEEYALKKMVCQEFDDLVGVKKKLELINSLNHENIMKIIKIQFKCLDFTTYAINAIMEKAITDWNNEIKNRAKNKNYYTENELINIAKQIISGLAFLQSKNIAHRDIKPQNILIFPNNIYKIADLGEMVQILRNSEKQLTIRGSASFLSPALKIGLEHCKAEVKHNAFKSDVFSLGYCFLYAMSLNMEILEKARAFMDNNDYKNIEIDIKKYIGNNRYSNKFIDFISKMIIENEKERKDFWGLKRELKIFEA